MKGKLISGSLRIGAMAIMLGCAALMASCDDGDKQSSVEATQPVVTPATSDTSTNTGSIGAPPAVPETVYAEKLMTENDPAKAIAMIKPFMTDEVNTPSSGALILGGWSNEHLSWKQLLAQPKTKYELVMKDSDQERSKLLCVYGGILEITAQTVNELKFFEGGLVDPDSGNIYRFIAIKSTGDLVERSMATFFGLVIGRFDYQNSGGGVTHSVQLVGMFKLPENMH